MQLDELPGLLFGTHENNQELTGKNGSIAKALATPVRGREFRSPEPMESWMQVCMPCSQYSCGELEVATGHFLHAHKLASLASVETSETLSQTSGGEKQ